MMKFLVFIVLFVSSVVNAQDLNEIRSQYPLAVSSSETASKLETILSNKDLSNLPILMAYKGAVLTLKAKFSKSRKDKQEFFKEGVSFIENAIKAENSNIEMRYIRLSVQENSPRFLGYHKNIEEDSQFIIDNYSKLTLKELKYIIKDYVLKSESFDENEKEIIKNH